MRTTREKREMGKSKVKNNKKRMSWNVTIELLISCAIVVIELLLSCAIVRYNILEGTETEGQVSGLS